jgi:hypothetical protein
VDPVGPVHIGLPCRTEHGCVVRSWAAKAVGGWIVAGVSLGFNNHAADPIDEQRGSDKILRNGDGIPGKERRG